VNHGTIEPGVISPGDLVTTTVDITLLTSIIIKAGRWELPSDGSWTSSLGDDNVGICVANPDIEYSHSKSKVYYCVFPTQVLQHVPIDDVK
jgi:hypothetical protein